MAAYNPLMNAAASPAYTTKRILLSLEDDPNLPSIIKWIAEQGSHPKEELSAQFVVDRGLGRYTLWVACLSCNRTWDSSITMQAVAREANSWDFVNSWLGPFLRTISSTACFKLSLMAELAEWVTMRVLESEPEGITYGALLQEAVQDHLCAPSDVDIVLETLKFVDNWTARHIYVPNCADEVSVRLVGSKLHQEGPVIRLPASHPLHPRNSHKCARDLAGVNFDWWEEN